MRYLARALAMLPLAFLVSAQVPRPRPMPPNAASRLRKMDPKQRKTLLESLPPDRRKQAADRLDRLDSLNADERRQLEQRWEFFRQMSPEDREKARNVFHDFNELSEERRHALLPEFETLRALAPPERAAHLNSADLKKRFSRKEMQILNRYSELSMHPGM